MGSRWQCSWNKCPGAFNSLSLNSLMVPSSPKLKATYFLHECQNKWKYKWVSFFYIQQIAVHYNIQMYTFQKGILVLLFFFALLQNHTFVIGQSDGHICFMNFFIYVWKCLPHEGGKVTSSTKKKEHFHSKTTHQTKILHQCLLHPTYNDIAKIEFVMCCMALLFFF